MHTCLVVEMCKDVSIGIGLVLILFTVYELYEDEECPGSVSHFTA